MSESDVVVFGYVAHDAANERHAQVVAFATALSKLAGLEVRACRTDSYAEITARMLRKDVDFAWLPPVPYIALTRRDAAEPLVSLMRDGHAEFYAVLIVRSDSKIGNPRDLLGKRAAWVDPHSASGYVLPRIGLAAVGIDPRTAFREERFFGSHASVVRAVVDHRADFGATFGGLDAHGKLARGAWSGPEASGVLTVLATFGAIPPDVVAARADLPTFVCESLTHALTHVSKAPELGALLVELFGASVELRRGTPEGYLEFCRATMRASDDGLLEGEEQKRST